MLKVFIPLLSGLMFLAPQASLADSITDFTLKVQTEQLQGQFQYKNATISPVAKLSVVCYPSNNDAQKKSYENIWYHDGKPIGLERLSALGIDKGKSVSIRFAAKTQAGVEEEKGTANLILRLVLDCYRNSDGVLAITVPGRNYDAIQKDLLAIGLVEGSPGVADWQGSQAKMTFTLQSDSDDRVKHLFYE